LYNLQQNLVTDTTSDTDDRELVMRLAPLYQQDRQKAINEGEQRLVIRQLNRRFGEIDTSLIEQIRSLSTDKLEQLAEALLDFSTVNQLEVWLNQQV
jgi:hypothetical protein